MHKRFLAILAIVTTIFAFGVGSALAERPEGAGPPDPHPGCENGKDNGCEDGVPGDGEEEKETPAESPLQPLCDALTGVNADLGGACQTIIDALGGDGAPALPPAPGGDDGDEGDENDEGDDTEGEPSPLQPICDGIEDADDNLAPVAGGCNELVKNIPAPPAGDDGDEGDDTEGEPSPLQPICDGIEDADDNLAPVAGGCNDLIGSIPAP